MASACGVWEREKEFYEALKKAGERLTKGCVDGLTNIALDDEWVCYKHVVALLARQMRRTAPGGRIAVLYVLSNILRFSKRRYAAKDKYADRVASVIHEIFSPLSECPAQLLCKVGRVVETWGRDGIFGEEDLGRISRVLGLGKRGRGGGAHGNGSCTREGEQRNANVDVFEEGTSLRDRTGFQIGFYPGGGSPSPKSGGGSNSGGAGGGQDTEDEEYDPLSAADYINGCQEAQEGRDLGLGLPIKEQGYLECGEEMVRINAVGKAGMPCGEQGSARNTSREGAGGGIGQKVAESGRENVARDLCGWDEVWPTMQFREKIGNVWVQRNIQAANGEQAWKHVVKFGSGTTKVGKGFCPIDYIRTCGFGQGMDGPPKMPLINQQELQPGLGTGNLNTPVGFVTGQRVVNTSAGTENGNGLQHTPEDGCFILHDRKVQHRDSGFHGIIPHKEPTQSAASSIMDAAESIAGSVCSMKEPWEPSGIEPDTIVPCPPTESPPPLPSESRPETPPPFTSNPPAPLSLNHQDMAQVQWVESKCGVTFRHQTHKVLASGLENCSIVKEPTDFLSRHSLPFPPS